MSIFTCIFKTPIFPFIFHPNNSFYIISFDGIFTKGGFNDNVNSKLGISQTDKK